jgi:DNA-binding transcriptional LysR family regulator
VLKSLDKNEVDFALVSVLPENLQIEAIPLLENKLFLISNKSLSGKVLNQKGNIMENLPLIYREQGSATRQEMESFLVKKNITVTKKLQLTSNEAVKQAVIAGLGLSIMPLIGLKNELLDDEIEIIPVKGLPITTFWHLIWLKGKKFTPAAKAYHNYLEQDKNSIIKENFQWHQDYH